MTGGSDYHGIIKPEVKLGLVGADQHISYELVEKLKEKVVRT
jgi:hypothetical protein